MAGARAIRPLHAGVASLACRRRQQGSPAVEFNFDEVKDRRGGHRAKWDHMEEACGVSPEDGIAMWVADMDFDAAPCILGALHADIASGFLGYFGNFGPVTEAVCDWMREMHGWPVEPGWVRYTHGVVAGFGMVLEAFSEPGDSVILFTPVYHAFFRKAAAMGRKVLQSELVLRDGRYEMDLEALATQLTGREKIAVLCSPHNPGGRLWTADEIAALDAFCAEHGLILCSDEIHMDLTFPGVAHLPTAVAAPASLPRLVTITAASKGFNIAGGETGFAIIPDDALRARFDRAHAKLGGTPNRFGMLMTKAAFTGGHEWSEAVRGYIAANFELWRARIGAIPGVRVMDMQATYLSWVDFRGTGMSGDESLERIRLAGIGVNRGEVFGQGGAGWHRFNIAMPRTRLIEAIERLEEAFADLQ
jgi:cystathionine beta-lyase